MFNVPAQRRACARQIQIPDEGSTAKSVRKYCRLESRLSLLRFVIGFCRAQSQASRCSASFLSQIKILIWTSVVHNICVPGQSLHHDPNPCLQVDLTGGIENGFAILRDPRGGTQFLLIPTTRISGIESATVRGPNATNYFASAWEVRTHIDDALHLTLPRDDIGLAINSVVSRSQDQLHIHFSCIRADVWETLHEHEGNIGNQWAPFNVSLVGHRYIAMWVSGEHLSPHNPFRLLAEGLPDATRDMGNRTLVVIGLT